MKKIIFAFCFIFLAAGFSLAREFRITGVNGQAALIPKGSKKASPIVKDLTVVSGDRIITGKKGRVEMSTKNGTVIELKENTNLEVRSLRGKVSRFFFKNWKIFKPICQITQE